MFSSSSDSEVEQEIKKKKKNTKKNKVGKLVPPSPEFVSHIPLEICWMRNEKRLTRNFWGLDSRGNLYVSRPQYDTQRIPYSKKRIKDFFIHLQDHSLPLTDLFDFENLDKPAFIKRKGFSRVIDQGTNKAWVKDPLMYKDHVKGNILYRSLLSSSSLKKNVEHPPIVIDDDDTPCPPTPNFGHAVESPPLIPPPTVSPVPQSPSSSPAPSPAPPPPPLSSSSSSSSSSSRSSTPPPKRQRKAPHPYTIPIGAMASTSSSVVPTMAVNNNINNTRPTPNSTPSTYSPPQSSQFASYGIPQQPYQCRISALFPPDDIGINIYMVSISLTCSSIEQQLSVQNAISAMLTLQNWNYCAPPETFPFHFTALSSSVFYCRSLIDPSFMKDYWNRVVGNLTTHIVRDFHLTPGSWGIKSMIRAVRPL